MQVLYLLPFVVLSFVSGVVCLSVPRWRRYAAGAIVSPIAFAGCSIVAMATAVLLTGLLGLERVMGFTEDWNPLNPHGIAVLMVIYFLPGAAGAVVAAMVANRVQRWILHSVWL